jgi:RNA polymerase sigma factor (sigma-70 family)
LTTENKNIDAVLIEKVKEGDSSAFKQLVEKYKDKSLSLACSILKDKAIAEDALQEAFIKVYLNAHSFMHKSAFSTWLFRIVVNSAYDALKQNKFYHNSNESNNNEPISHQAVPMHNLKEEDQKKYIIMALDKLKSDESLVLRLFYLCEMSLMEIKEITNFSPSKIRVDLYRGRKNMETAFDDLLGKQSKDLL